MEDFLDTLRENLISIVAVIVIVALFLGYTYFTTNSILPQLRERQALLPQVEQLDGDIAIGQGTQSQSFDTLLTRLESGPERLALSANRLLAPSVPDRMVDALYRYASDTGVNIVELTVSTLPNTETALVRETIFLMRASGDFLDLTRFVGAIEEATTSGFVLSNLLMTANGDEGTLTATVTLYDSSLSTTVPGEIPLTAGETSGGTTALAPTPTPVPPRLQHQVVAGETLLNIAVAYKVPLDALRDANGLQESNVEPGQLLTIPR